MAWNQPTYYSTPTMTYAPSYQTTQTQSAFVTQPFQTQPTLQFVPSGNFEQRLMTYPSSPTRGFAGRRVNNPYR
jgi:hypothetical protein